MGERRIHRKMGKEMAGVPFSFLHQEENNEEVGIVGRRR